MKRETHESSSTDSSDEEGAPPAYMDAKTVAAANSQREQEVCVSEKIGD